MVIKLIFKTLMFYLLSVFVSVYGQNTQIALVDLDSVYEQVGFFKENNTFLKNIKADYEAKDSVMILKFVNSCKEFEKNYANCCYCFQIVDKEKQILTQEGQRIMKFDSAVTKFPTVLSNHLKSWSDDYIKQKVRLYAQLNNVKTILSSPLASIFTNLSPSNGLQIKPITDDIITFIKNDDIWKEALTDYRTFITNKVLFDYGLK